MTILKQRLKDYAPKFVVFYGKEYRLIYESIIGSTFDDQGFAWGGPTLCALVQHPAGQNIPNEMKSGDWWIKKGNEIRELLASAAG